MYSAKKIRKYFLSLLFDRDFLFTTSAGSFKNFNFLTHTVATLCKLICDCLCFNISDFWDPWIGRGYQHNKKEVFKGIVYFI